MRFVTLRYEIMTKLTTIAVMTALLMAIDIMAPVPAIAPSTETSTISGPLEFTDISQPQVTDMKTTELTGRYPMTTTSRYTSLLPIVLRRHRCRPPCPVACPFSLQIADLHQVVPSEEQARITLLEALEESGACWARVRIDWSTIEPTPPQEGEPPVYVWGPYHDEKLRLVAETGLQLIAIVHGAPDWAADLSCAPIYPDRLDEFAQFLTDLVNRYKQPPYNIHHWELFNEPDGTTPDRAGVGQGCGGFYGDQYSQMLAWAYPAIKAADPEATVLMGGLAYDRFTENGGPFHRYFPDDVMATGGAEFLDVLNFHYFPDFRAEWERWIPEGNPATCGDVEDGVGPPYAAWGIDLIAKTNHFRNRLYTCFGVDKPVWVTEMAEHGYTDNPDSLAQQARYVIQGYTRGLAAGVENITWYALTTGDAAGQGLLYNDLTPKPAYYAYQTLTRELTGYEYARTLDLPDGEGYVFRDSYQQEKTVAWGSGTLALAPASRLRVADRKGNVFFIRDGGVRDMDGTQNEALELQLAADPVFISK